MASLVFHLQNPRELRFCRIQLVSPVIRIGDLRFRHPEPYGPYSDVVDATKSGSSCPQLQPKLVIPEGLSPPAISYAKSVHADDDGSEDCEPRLPTLP